MTNVVVPPARVALVGMSEPTREYYRFFNDLVMRVNVKAPNEGEFQALEVRVSKLEDDAENPQSGTVRGTLSIHSQGLLQNGIVFLRLVGDEGAPGATAYYGTNTTGGKGWYAVADAFTDSVNVGKSVDTDGVTSFDLTDVTDTNTGTLQAITRDAKGRVTGTTDATITGTAGRVTVANGDASSGKPTIDLAQVPDAGGGSLLKIVRDLWGRVTGTSSAVIDDLSDVDAPTPSNNDALVYNSTSGNWEPGTAGTSSPLTTKGDLYGYGTDNARIPVGADGQGLIADSSQPLGVRWGGSLGGLYLKDRFTAYASLPTTGNTAGDAYLVDGPPQQVYVWDGSAWPAQGDGISFGTDGGGHLIGPGLVLNTGTNIVRLAQTGDIQIDTTSISRTQGQAGTFQLVASGGTDPDTWTVDTLPTGMTMDSAGLITDAGTASVGDTTSVFSVKDANGDKVNRAIVVSVANATVAKWWRVLITANNGNTYLCVATLEYHTSIGGSDICTGGTAFATESFSSEFSPDKAFDGNLSTSWSSNGSALPLALGYQLPTPQSVNEVVVGFPPSGEGVSSLQQAPKDFTVQSSVTTTNGLDGTWNDEWSVSGQTGWSWGETRSFARP